MTATQPISRTTFEHWDILAARLMLAHLEDDEISRELYRAIIKAEVGIPDEHLHLADRTAGLFSTGYKRPESREKARAVLLNYLDQLL